MRLVGQFDFSGIRRIVINRIIVWECHNSGTTKGIKPFWLKTAGGKGFDPKKNVTKSPDQMKKTVQNLLEKIHTLECIKLREMKTRELKIKTLAYRAWQNQDTLNVVSTVMEER